MKIILWLFGAALAVTLGAASLRIFAAVQERQQHIIVEDFNANPVWVVMHAMEAYRHHHYGRFPNAARWEDDIRPYWHSGNDTFTVLLFTPSGEQQHRFAMNVNLSGVNGEHLQDADQVVVLYETRSNHPNSNGVPVRLPHLHRNDGFVQYLICGDGRDEEGREGCGIAFNSPISAPVVPSGGN